MGPLLAPRALLNKAAISRPPRCVGGPLIAEMVLCQHHHGLSAP